MGKSSRNGRPSKPYPDFPLYPHASGRWAKKIRGKLHYFGKWAEDRKGKAAEALYNAQREDLHAGRTPSTRREGLTVKDLCDHFLFAKESRVESGELAPVTFRDYRAVCLRMADFFGRSRFVEDLRIDDFDEFRRELAKTNKAVGVRNKVAVTRMVFIYAHKRKLIDRPVEFGPDFVKPSAKVIRKQRTPRMFQANEIRRMLDAAGPTMKAMILLGVNCGFGCADVGRLPRSAVDLTQGWVAFPRPKTGANRLITLLPETVDAITEAIEDQRAGVGDAAQLVFVTKRGGSWHKESTRYLTEQFRKFLQAVDVEAESKAAAEGFDPPEKLYRQGRGFYTFRHVCETIGGETCDQVAVDAIMGHERNNMADQYREGVSNQRLQAVVDTLHDWLFSDEPQIIEERADEGEEPAVIKFPSAG